MLVKVGTDYIESDDISSIVELSATDKPVPGAAFAYKPDTEVALKTGKTVVVTAASAQSVMDQIKDQLAGVKKSDTAQDYTAVVTDLIEEVGKAAEHLHTISEMLTRYVLRNEGKEDVLQRFCNRKGNSLDCVAPQGSTGKIGKETPF